MVMTGVEARTFWWAIVSMLAVGAIVVFREIRRYRGLNGLNIYRERRYLRQFHSDETGQGMIEYLLVVCLIAMAVTSGMNTAASYIDSAFVRVGQRVAAVVCGCQPS